MSGSSTCKITLQWPTDVQQAVHDVFTAATSNEAVDEQLSRWLNGQLGPLLLAARIDNGSAPGAFHATLELSDGFLQFSATVRAGDFQRHSA